MRQQGDGSGVSLVDRYVLPPAEIEARSLATVAAALRDRYADADERFVAARILYAAGDLDLAPAVRFSTGAVAAGVAALRRGAAIVADTRMVVSGISGGGGNVRNATPTIYCAIDDAAVAERAGASALPRAVEAMRTLKPYLNGAIVAIGNAPTALLSLLDMVDSGDAAPALIAGMPVGFVAATESKRELMRRQTPFITVDGTRGGSALAAAAINALLRLGGPATAAQVRSRTAVLFAGHGSRARDAAEAMLAAVERVRGQKLFPIVEVGYLELASPDLPAALARCVGQGATRVLVVPYFLNNGLHIRRDIPEVLRREADRYPNLTVSMGRPIGLHADLANVMLAGALESEQLPDIRAVPQEPVPARGARMEVQTEAEDE